MITKQILFSALILGATAKNITLAMDKPIEFTINIDNKKIILPNTINKEATVVIDTTSQEEPYSYTIEGDVETLENNKEAIKIAYLKKSNNIPCLYCPLTSTVALDVKHNNCDKVDIARLIYEYQKLEQANKNTIKKLDVIQQILNK